MMRTIPCVIALCALAAGCGQSANPGDGGVPDLTIVDLEPPADLTPPPDLAPTARKWDEPREFDRSGCVPGSLKGLDPSGLWHHDVTLRPGAPSVAFVAQRFSDGKPLTATIMEHGAEAWHTDDDLLVRAEWKDRNRTRIWAFDACGKNPDGSLFGKAMLCWNEAGCFPGTFRSVKIARRMGEAEADGLQLIGEWRGGANPWQGSKPLQVRVVDRVAYVATKYDGLRIVDVTDPTKMADLAHVGPGEPGNGELINDVRIVDHMGRRFALLASDVRGVAVVDVTDPRAPMGVTSFGDGPVHTLFTEQRNGVTRAYLANTGIGGLEVHDVTDPGRPIRLADFVHPEVESSFPAYLHDLYVEAGIAYLNYWNLGFVIVDATDASQGKIREVGRYKDYERRTSHSNWVTRTRSGRTIAVVGDEDFHAHLHVVDVDPKSPEYMKRIGELSLRPEVSIHNIMAFGDIAYIAWYQDGLRLIDLADPTRPRPLAHYNTWDLRAPGMSPYEGALGLDVDLANGLIYLAESTRGLMVFRRN